MRNKVTGKSFDLNLLEQLFTSPFVASSLRDQELFCSLIGIGGYLREDVFRDRYGVVWARGGAPDYATIIRDSSNGEILWESADDILASVAFSRWELACASLPEMLDLTTIFGSTIADPDRLFVFYDRFDKMSFERAVYPGYNNITTPSSNPTTTPWN